MVIQSSLDTIPLCHGEVQKHLLQSRLAHRVVFNVQAHLRLLHDPEDLRPVQLGIRNVKVQNVLGHALQDSADKCPLHERPDLIDVMLQWVANRQPDLGGRCTVFGFGGMCHLEDRIDGTTGHFDNEGEPLCEFVLQVL